MTVRNVTLALLSQLDFGLEVGARKLPSSLRQRTSPGSSQRFGALSRDAVSVAVVQTVNA